MTRGEIGRINGVGEGWFGGDAFEYVVDLGAGWTAGGVFGDGFGGSSVSFAACVECCCCG